ncbi:hypothetical protein [Prevotella veroralis]|nr:hypothetical protein [Prevotella veroralis]
MLFKFYWTAIINKQRGRFFNMKKRPLRIKETPPLMTEEPFFD